MSTLQKSIITYLLPLMLALSSVSQSQASDLETTYLLRLKKIHKVTANTEKLYELINNSANKLVKKWSPELARELARVFNKLLDNNPNYYVVELVDSLLKARPTQFRPIFDKALSKKNKKLYKKLLKMDEDEEKYGNG